MKRSAVTAMTRVRTASFYPHGRWRRRCAWDWRELGSMRKLTPAQSWLCETAALPAHATLLLGVVPLHADVVHDTRSPGAARGHVMHLARCHFVRNSDIEA